MSRLRPARCKIDCPGWDYPTRLLPAEVLPLEIVSGQSMVQRRGIVASLGKLT